MLRNKYIMKMKFNRPEDIPKLRTRFECAVH